MSGDDPVHDWFQWYVQQTEKQKSRARYRERYVCPCCFMPTLQARAAYDAYEICDWEDDGQDSDEPMWCAVDRTATTR